MATIVVYNPMKYPKVQEETLKNKVAHDFFAHFDCTKIIEKIAFTVKSKKAILDIYLLWAEAKTDSTDIAIMLTQLILAIGKARTFDTIPPPPYLGCFDREKIAFIPHHAIQEIFYKNDFNWKVTPSNHTSREFKEVHERVQRILDTDATNETLVFDFQKDEKDLKQFIHENFIVGKSETTKIQIDKNNFVSIYIKWLEMVKPTIQVKWELIKKAGIIDGDFYLADLLSHENETLREKLFVLLKSKHCELDQKLDTEGFFNSRKAGFTDQQKAHNQFWSIYERPPLEEYWDYIIERRDLLVPQDIRERKGSFFTPRIWVELSQKYIADVLGENWQDEYYVWDCAAGTGNLLAGLTNKYNIWASTLDKADVNAMLDRIENGANLLKDHVFQFDFLNDDFSKLPAGLQDIINDQGKRKKLVIYINPPYVEASSTATATGTGRNKTDVAIAHKTRDRYKAELGAATNEVFAHFIARVYAEIPQCRLAFFSKLKFINGQNYQKFRSFFQAEFERGFVVPANSFDNVKGKFPIGFTIWNLNGCPFPKVLYLVIAGKEEKKKFWAHKGQSINQWIIKYNRTIKEGFAYLANPGPDFQHINQPYLTSLKGVRHLHYFACNETNIIEGSIYFAVRLCIEPTWLNDRDQFLYPNNGWKFDKEFQNDCLAFTLFHDQNRIQSQYSTNHWIPFTESEIQAPSKFESNFMTDFIAGKIASANDLLSGKRNMSKPLTFSKEAKAVFEAGRELWRYYHSLPDCNVNAGLYDIREHFQGRNAQGKMNAKSDDATYMELIGNLRSALKVLADNIAPKVYEFGFLKE